jgi:hypothetical protein
MLKIGERHLNDEFITRGTCIVDQYSNRAKCLVRFREKSSDVFFLAYIGLDLYTAPAKLLDRGTGFSCCAGMAAIVNNYIGSGLCEPLCCRTTNTLAAAGYYCHPTR